MRNRYKFDDSKNQLYFVTLTVIAKIPVFTNSRYMNILTLLRQLNFFRTIYCILIITSIQHIVLNLLNYVVGLIDNLKFYRKEEGLKIFYYVIIDNHIQGISFPAGLFPEGISTRWEE